MFKQRYAGTIIWSYPIRSASYGSASIVIGIFHVSLDSKYFAIINVSVPMNEVTPIIQLITNF